MSNVVERLNQRIAEVKQMGFRVRTELLDGPAANWCLLGRQKVVFLDLSHSASEQLLQLDESIASYLAQTQAKPTTTDQQVA
ncbi:hypothetical protein [Planctomycetes bacterium K23_9]|uniref:Uncharacterized protein n=1 Tax=Stieleria marina TaxID=1930275 RepID=A0A517NPN7_9BACT|nr:hypothetical protein K239x_10200 [Planctomycetes bacterium K23_9]